MPPATPLGYKSNSSRLLNGLSDGIYFLFPLALVLGICLLGVSALNKKTQIEQQTELNLFPTNKVLEVEITLEKDDWNTIRNQSRNLFEALEAKRKDGPVKGPYTWVTAKVKIDGEEFPEIGLRKKGKPYGTHIVGTGKIQLPISGFGCCSFCPRTSYYLCL